MRHWALISLLILLFAEWADGASATVYLYSGNDSYGQGLGYPGYATPLSFYSFAAGNNTTPVSPVLLQATIFRPEFVVQLHPKGSVVNDSAYSHPILPLWEQYTFFLPLSGISDWFFGSYDGPTSSVNNFLKDGETASSANYETTSVRQFALKDSYYPGIEAHDDPTRMGLNHFLDSDEPPGRPLL
ncbi:MAG: hypothetical protein QG666_757 [Euryarchaeota archaeon]|nr:hypothetical protein [Euryarchaeota archaeon]